MTPFAMVTAETKRGSSGSPAAAIRRWAPLGIYSGVASLGVGGAVPITVPPHCAVLEVV